MSADINAPDWSVITPTLVGSYRVMRDNGIGLDCIHETQSETEAIVMCSGHPTRAYVYRQNVREFNNWRPLPVMPEGDTP